MEDEVADEKFSIHPRGKYFGPLEVKEGESAAAPGWGSCGCFFSAWKTLTGYSLPENAEIRNADRCGNDLPGRAAEDEHDGGWYAGGSGSHVVGAHRK